MVVNIPLQNHSLEPIVQYQGFHFNTKLASCLEFHSSQAEVDFSININSSLVWSGNLHTNSYQQTKAVRVGCLLTNR